MHKRWTYLRQILKFCNCFGFAYLEIMLAFVILTVVLTPIIGLTVVNQKGASDSQQKIIALNLAQDRLESYKNRGGIKQEDLNSEFFFADHPSYTSTVTEIPQLNNTSTVTVTVFFQNRQVVQLTGEVESRQQQ